MWVLIIKQLLTFTHILVIIAAMSIIMFVALPFAWRTRRGMMMMRLFHRMLYLNISWWVMWVSITRTLTIMRLMAFFLFRVLRWLRESLGTCRLCWIFRSSLNDRVSPSYQRLEVQVHFSMLLYNFINHSSSFLVFFKWTFDKDIPKIRVRNLLLCNLYPCTAFKLQWSNCVTTFSNYQSNALIWHRDNISVRTGWTVRCQKMILNWHWIVLFT